MAVAAQMVIRALIVVSRAPSSSPFHGSPRVAPWKGRKSAPDAYRYVRLSVGRIDLIVDGWVA
jgi:hypothetical protein